METRPEVSEGDPQETQKCWNNKFNPGSTDIFEFQVRNLELFEISVPTSQEYVHKNQNDISSRAGDIPNFVGFH